MKLMFSTKESFSSADDSPASSESSVPRTSFRKSCVDHSRRANPTMCTRGIPPFVNREKRAGISFRCVRSPLAPKMKRVSGCGSRDSPSPMSSGLSALSTGILPFLD